MKVRIGVAARNALTLVARRYRIPRERIVEIAPLLFFVTAELSLNMRRKQIRDLRAAEDAAYEAAIPHLQRTAAIDQEAIELEEKSIEACDLFAEQIGDSQCGNDDPDYDSARENPFARYLSQLIREARGDGERIEPARCSKWVGPSYEICSNEALLITGGDREASEAILAGFAALHERPRTDLPAEIAAWAKAERERAARSAAEEWASLGIALEGEKP